MMQLYTRGHHTHYVSICLHKSITCRVTSYWVSNLFNLALKLPNEKQLFIPVWFNHWYYFRSLRRSIRTLDIYCHVKPRLQRIKEIKQDKLPSGMVQFARQCDKVASRISFPRTKCDNYPLGGPSRVQNRVKCPLRCPSSGENILHRMQLVPFLFFSPLPLK